MDVVEKKQRKPSSCSETALSASKFLLVRLGVTGKTKTTHEAGGNSLGEAALGKKYPAIRKKDALDLRGVPLKPQQ